LKPRKIERIFEAEKIAAGEVVDRPVNIVKELVENSIDAEASEIRVIVKKAGKSLIQVLDNGCGIPSEDIVIAFERHTSSKIRRIEDLENLSTLGFRGEALASIAAVSKVEIISRTEIEDKGIQLFIEGSKIINKREISCPIGTDIKVKNIFYNLPARQKFLKKDTTELGHITDIIQRYSLAYPGIHFIYRHNNLDILNCPAMNDLKTTVFHVCGKKIAKFAEFIDFEEENVYFKVNGLLGHPEISKKNRNYSSLFINRRYVISDLLSRAIQEAYKGTLMVGKYPFYILHINLDPSVIDFNVHPKKLHIRFEQDDYIYNKVYNIIRAFIEEKFIAKEAKYLSIELDDFVPKSEISSFEEDNSKTRKLEKPIKEIREKNKSTMKSADYLTENGELIDETVQLKLIDGINEEDISKVKTPDTFLRKKFIIAENFPKLRLISYTGQLSNKTYVALEGFNQETNEQGLYILDQHAASERIKKEIFLKAYETSKMSKQKLISPLKIDVSPSEKYFLQGNLNEIKKLGFNFEHFGGNTFLLRDIPTIIEKTPKTEIIKEIISDLSEIGKDKSFSEVKEDIINYLACHKSIRGGDDLSLKDIRDLLIELGECKDSYHCAHGRPTLRFFSFKELDKLFKRIV